MDATVGIILRTKNRPVLLKRAIDSVMRQTYQDWVLVIVNDGGSREDVDNILRMFPAELLQKTKLIHNETAIGISQAANQGIQSIKTKLVAIHDDDDTWSPEFLNLTVNTLEEMHERHDSIRGIISHANAVYEKMEGNIVVADRIEPRFTYTTKLVDVRSIFKENPFPSIAFLFYSDSLDEIGYFNEKSDFAEFIEWDFHKMFLLQYDVAIIPEYLAFKHKRTSAVQPYMNLSTIDESTRQLHLESQNNQQVRMALVQNSNEFILFENNTELTTNKSLLNDLVKLNAEMMGYLKYFFTKLNQ